MKMHTPSKTIKCEHCDKEFSRADNYKNHLRTHSNSKPFKCVHCFSEFTYRSSFNRHVQTHDTIFFCDVCSKTFRRADYVEGHKKLMHPEVYRKSNQHADTTQLVSSIETAPRLNNKLKAKQTRPHKKETTKIKNFKKKKKRKQHKEAASANENINAVPILISMAEQAAKPKFVDPVNALSPEVVEIIEEDEDEDLPSTSYIADDLISFINNDDSSESDDVIYTEDEDEDDDEEDDDDSSSSSDRLEVISDSEFQD